MLSDFFLVISLKPTQDSILRIDIFIPCSSGVTASGVTVLLDRYLRDHCSDLSGYREGVGRVRCVVVNGETNGLGN